MRFEVLPAVKVSMLIFWVVMPCGLTGRYQRFEGTYCLHLLGLNEVVGKWVVYIGSERGLD
jgi:hypothetical protein